MEDKFVIFECENFKAEILANKTINRKGNKELLLSEAAVFRGEINVDNKNINSLVGIEAFTNFTKLNCAHNQLIEIDLSKNTALATLNCYYNQLINLDLSNNKILTRLVCYFNKLSELDLSKNAALIYLKCDFNKLSELDVSKNTYLRYLLCDDTVTVIREKD